MIFSRAASSALSNRCLFLLACGNANIFGMKLPEVLMQITQRDPSLLEKSRQFVSFPSVQALHDTGCIQSKFQFCQYYKWYLKWTWICRREVLTNLENRFNNCSVESHCESKGSGFRTMKTDFRICPRERMEPVSSCHLFDLIDIREYFVLFCQTKASPLRPLSESKGWLFHYRNVLRGLIFLVFIEN